MQLTDPIQTSQVLPGIWYATFGDYDLDDPIGTGFTEQEAIADLREQVESDWECGACGGTEQGQNPSVGGAYCVACGWSGRR